MKKIVLVIILIIFILLSLSLFFAQIIIGAKNSGGNTELYENEVSIYSYDGLRLVAEKRVQSDYTNKWVIFVHSYRTSKDDFKNYTNVYFEKGYNILSPDNRAHGKSEGKYIGMGYKDRKDLSKWIDYIIEEDNNAEIVLHGVSMGSASILMLSGNEECKSNVKAVVCDCSYASVESYLTYKIKSRFNIPKYPVIPLTDIGFRLLGGYSLYDASVIKNIENCTVPTFIIHGDKDQSVPLEDGYKIYDGLKCQKELLVVKGARHGGSMHTDKELYWQRVFEFINKYQGV